MPVFLALWLPVLLLTGCSGYSLDYLSSRLRVRMAPQPERATVPEASPTPGAGQSGNLAA